MSTLGPHRGFAAMPVPPPNIAVGDLVSYRPSHGMGAALNCRVIGFGVEAGRLVIDNDLGQWGYAEQYAPAPQERSALGQEGFGR